MSADAFCELSRFFAFSWLTAVLVLYGLRRFYDGRHINLMMLGWGCLGYVVLTTSAIVLLLVLEIGTLLITGQSLLNKCQW